jgi:hypothetical protein
MIPPKLPDWQMHWIDRGIAPKNPPDPKYPDGIDLDVSRELTPSCKSPLAYPTPRCGYWVIQCRTCGAHAIVTTAGRSDDPRSFRMACEQGDNEEVQ